MNKNTIFWPGALINSSTRALQLGTLLMGSQFPQWSQELLSLFDRTTLSHWEIYLKIQRMQSNIPLKWQSSILSHVSRKPISHS